MRAIWFVLYAVWIFIRWFGLTVAAIFKKLDPTYQLGLVAFGILVAVTYVRSDLLDRNVRSLNRKVVDPTGNFVYGAFRTLGVIAICVTLAVAAVLVIRTIINLNKPQKVEDIPTTDAIQENIPWLQRLRSSRKNKGGDE